MVVAVIMASVVNAPVSVAGSIAEQPKVDFVEVEGLPGKVGGFSWENRSRLVKANVLCIHGLGLSSLDYLPFARTMAARGYAVYALNVTGFGPLSERNANSRLDLSKTLKDIGATLKALRSAYPERKTFLLGESMGGAIALKGAQLYPDLVDGLVCSSPSWRFRGTWSKSLVYLLSRLAGTRFSARVLSRMIVKQATKITELRTHWMHSCDHRLLLRPSEMFAFLKFVRHTPEYARGIVATPVIFIQGASDRLTDPGQAARLFRFVGSERKTFVLDTSGEHVVFEEGQASECSINALCQWLETCELNTVESKAGFVIGDSSGEHRRSGQVQHIFKLAGLAEQILPRCGSEPNSIEAQSKEQ